MKNKPITRLKLPNDHPLSGDLRTRNWLDQTEDSINEFLQKNFEDIYQIASDSVMHEMMYGVPIPPEMVAEKLSELVNKN